MIHRRWNLTGEVVVRKIKAVQPEQGRYGRRKLAGKVVVRQKQKLQCGEVREIGDWTGKAVSLETHDSEPSQRAKRLKTTLQV